MNYTEQAYWGKIIDISDSINKISQRALKNKKPSLKDIEKVWNFFDSCKLASEMHFSGQLDFNPKTWINDSNFERVYLPTVYSDTLPKNIEFYISNLDKLKQKKAITKQDSATFKRFSEKMQDYIP